MGKEHTVCQVCVLFLRVKSVYSFYLSVPTYSMSVVTRPMVQQLEVADTTPNKKHRLNLCNGQAK